MFHVDMKMSNLYLHAVINNILYINKVITIAPTPIIQVRMLTLLLNKQLQCIITKKFSLIFLL